MKFILGLFALFVIAGAVIYYTSIAGFDPNEQGKKARETIKPGMTWEEVIKLTTTPNQFQVVTPDPAHPDRYAHGFDQKFKMDTFKALVGSGSTSHGFSFEYLYSSREHFNVYFDENGKVESVGIIPGMADLLQQR